MKTFSFDNEARLNLIKDAQKAINKACFVPSKEAKSEALKAVKMLATFVEGLETSKPKPKASEQPKVETVDVQSLIAEATAKAVAEALAKLGVAQPKEQPKAQPKAEAKSKDKSKTSRKAVRRTAKTDSNTRLEAQAQRASRGVAKTYLPKEEAVQDKSKDKSKKQMALPFEHEEGRCPIEEARHAAFLAMQEALLDGAPMDTDGYMDEYSF
jgi:hypothetical protein